MVNEEEEENRKGAHRAVSSFLGADGDALATVKLEEALLFAAEHS